MALSASFSLASSHYLSQLCYSDLKWKQKRLEFLKPHRRTFHHLWNVKSVLNSKRSSSINDNGATEPARILLERLFAQTQKLEEQIGRDPFSPHVAELGVNLVKLESDLHDALAALKKKDEYLQDAEKKILLEYNEINLARKDLERREEEISAAQLKQEKLEEDLRLANIDLASQATEIGNLKLRLKERAREISALQSSLSAKKWEIIRTKHELMKKSKKAADFESELRSKSRILDEANKIVGKQNLELQQLRMEIQKKEEELEISIRMQKSESEKLKIAEAKLEKQTMDWLVVREELKNLGDETSTQGGGANATVEEFGRVRKLLSDVRSELVSSQKALASSRQQMNDQDRIVDKQLREIEELRTSVMSYLMDLRDAEVEVESERAKLRLANAQNKKLEMDLDKEKEVVDELQKELEKVRSSLEQAIQEMSALKEEIDLKSAAFEESQRLLEAKESELVEARLEIQRLNSEQSSLQLILEEKDLELSDAKMRLEEVNKEIAELKVNLFNKEDELIQAMSMLKEKDEHVQAMQHELGDAKLKFSEAETVVEKIVNLTKEVVNDEGYYALSPLYQKNDSFKWQIKQLESELNFTRESLKAKEMEVLAAEKDLTIKSEELRTVLEKLDAREKEIAELQEEMMRDKDDIKQLYALAQETIGEKSVGELAIDKLQLEAAQLEVEAATNALYKITEMSQQLLDKARLSIEDDYNTDLRGSEASINMINIEDDYNTDLRGSEASINMMNDDKCSTEVESEVSRLLALTEQLVREARIADNVKQ